MFYDIFWYVVNIGLFCHMNKNVISTCTFLCAMVYKITQNLISGVLKRTLTRVCNVKYRFCYQNQNPPSYTIWKVTSAIWLETSTDDHDNVDAFLSLVYQNIPLHCCQIFASLKTPYTYKIYQKIIHALFITILQ